MSPVTPLTREVRKKERNGTRNCRHAQLVPPILVCRLFVVGTIFHKPQYLLGFLSFCSGAPPGSSQILKTWSVEEVLMILNCSGASAGIFPMICCAKLRRIIETYKNAPISVMFEKQILSSLQDSYNKLPDLGRGCSGGAENWWGKREICWISYV